MIRLPNVYTIVPGVPFARTLAESLWHEYRDDRLALSSVEIYLPNRRSIIAMTDAFLEASDGQAALLPRLLPIGDIDEDNLFETDPFILDDMPDLAPAISPVERHLLLTQLLLKRNDIYTAHQAHALAVELARLIDRAHTENVDLNQIHELVPGDLATHWQITRDFLAIVTETWPKILVERGELDPALRRNLIIQRKTQALLDKQPRTRMIAAGSTGSIPATAQFLNAVARMPNGCIILPGFDPKLDKKTWDNIDLQHPYFYMKRLIEVFSIEPRHVKLWPGVKDPHKTQCDLQGFILDALQPIEIFDLSEAKIKSECLGKHEFIMADNPLQEARLIAILLRDIISHPGKTAMVVTPDRDLAKSLQTEMLRWDIHVNDSGGETLNVSSTGVFLRAIAQFPNAAQPATAALALLRHAFTRLGKVDDFETLNKIERVLRQNILPPGGLRVLAETEDLKLLNAFLDIMTPPNGEKRPLKDWLTWHLRAAEQLSLHSDDNPSSLWRHDDGEAAAQLFHNLMLSDQLNSITLTLPDYEQLIAAWMAQVTLRPRYRLHPRIRILSPVEARLQHADVTILAGLNENVWPMQPDPNPWLSRPMELELGFAEAERRIGQSTLDFLILFCAEQVYVTWSKQRDGVLAQPSRWLQQISAIFKRNKMPLVSDASPYLSWTKSWDAPSRVAPRNAPETNPPVTSRPREFWVTDLETWQKDPYSFYAKRILSLRPWPLLDRGVDHQEWGTVVHRVLEYFFNQDGLNRPDARNLYKTTSHNVMSIYALNPSQRRQWSDRMGRIGQWILQNNDRTARLIVTELTLSYQFMPFDNESFKLSGKADRIDVTLDGLVITDYKTGKPPSGVAVQSGKSPQLPLLGWLAEHGEDARLRPANIGALHYAHLTGKAEKPAELKPLKEPDKLIELNERNFTHLLDRYYRQNASYPAKIIASNDYDDYAQLKRVAEWASLSNDAEEIEYDEADA